MTASNATTQCTAPSTRFGDPCVVDSECDNPAGAGNGVCSSVCAGGMREHLPCADTPDCSGPVYVFHEGLIPSVGPHNQPPITRTTYTVEVIDTTCDRFVEDSYSVSLQVTTSKWGDTVLDLQVTPYAPPNGIVAILDVLSILAKFQNTNLASVSARVDLLGSIAPNYVPDHMVTIGDVVQALFAFQAVKYPASGRSGFAEGAQRPVLSRLRILRGTGG